MLENKKERAAFEKVMSVLNVKPFCLGQETIDLLQQLSQESLAEVLRKSIELQYVPIFAPCLKLLTPENFMYMKSEYLIVGGSDGSIGSPLETYGKVLCHEIVNGKNSILAKDFMCSTMYNILNHLEQYPEVAGKFHQFLVAADELKHGDPHDKVDLVIKQIEELATRPEEVQLDDDTFTGITTVENQGEKNEGPLDAATQRSTDDRSGTSPNNDESSGLYKMISDHPYIAAGIAVISIAAVGYVACNYELLGDWSFAKNSELV